MAIRGEGAVRVGLDGTGYEIGLMTPGTPGRCLRRWRAAWLPPLRGCCPAGRRRQAAGPGWTQGIGERAEPTEVR